MDGVQCSMDVITDYAINMRNNMNLSTTILPIHHYVFFVLETNVIFPSSGGNVNHPRHFFDHIVTTPGATKYNKMKPDH